MINCRNCGAFISHDWSNLSELCDECKEKKITEWCPQHGYPKPCVKCNGMTREEWDRFFESLAKAVMDDS